MFIRCEPAAAGVRSVGVAVVLGMAALVFGWTGRCRADGEGLPGRVVDRAGTGAADVQVWAVGGERDHPRVVVRATTDDGGWFVLARPTAPRGPQDETYLKILAVARDGRLGWRLAMWPDYPQKDALRIVLGPVGEVRGRVHDQDGRPIAGAEVTPLAASLAGVDHPGRDSFRMPPELAGPLRATTGADGSFAIKGIPEGANLEAAIVARGFGPTRISWETARAATIVLDGRLGRIEGRLEAPDARGLSGTLSLSLRSRMPSDAGSPGPVPMMVFRTVAADKDGAFRFGDLQPGTYEITPSFGPDAPFSADPVEKVEVGPNAVARVEVPLVRHVTITGRIVNARTGRGIPDVGVRGEMVTPQNHLRFTGQAKTDAEGRYTMGTRRGPLQVSLSSVPKAYLGIRSSLRPTLDVQADRAWPDLKLDPAIALDGVVVDGAGKPVAGAAVFALPPDPSGFHGGGRGATTGPDGTFHFDQIDPDDTLPVWARTREATTDGMVVIRPGELKGKLTLAIDPKFAFRIRGRVTDRSGKRIAGAQVVVSWYRSYVSGKLDRPGMGIGGTLETLTTDASGWFVFRGLWPGDRYKVVIDARDYGKAEPPEIKGKAGETLDLGTIALTGTGGHIAGRVVGTDGRPIAGAIVFNRGDAPMPLTADTDASGRFRLEGLFPGTRYAFVRKDGYRFAGARVDDDADDLVITLRKPDEPPPAWKPGVAPTLEAQRAFARKVLVRIWETFGERAEESGASACIPAMARIDLDLALQWSAQRGHHLDARARLAAAEELAETDGPGALELLGLVDGRGKQNALQELAERFAESDRGKALAFAEEAAVQGRSLPQPDRTWALAQAGAVLVRLGPAGAGRKLIDEAAGDAARLGSAGLEGYARACAARELAPFDLERALKLVEPFRSADEHERYTGFVAVAIAGTHPDRAVALADAMHGRSTVPDMVRTEIAYRIGVEHPDRAVRIIEGMKTFGAAKLQAEAFAWLAVAVAPRDRARAVALIDRALAMPIDQPREFQTWINSGGASAASAHIAAAARHAGYLDMDGAILRVMAVRTSPGGSFFDPAMEIQAAAMAAVPLALVDPGAARVLLEQIEARGGLDPARLAEVGGYDWLRAWGLVDLEKAGAYVDAQLAALEKTRGARLANGPIFRMIDILVIPPARREARIFDVDGPSWRPAFRY